MKPWCLQAGLYLLTTTYALADSMGLPSSQETFSSDHKLVYVSLVKETYGRNELNEKYPKSGLYRVDEKRKPLWPFEWGGDVEVSKDSKHLVFWGPWPPLGDGGSTDALYFVSKGKLVRTYQIKELAVGPMPRSVSHYSWCKESRLDDANGTFQATAYAGPDGSAGTTYVFDLETGVIVSKRIPLKKRVSPWGWVGISGGLTLFMVAALIFHVSPRRRTRRFAVVRDP